MSHSDPMVATARRFACVALAGLLAACGEASAPTAATGAAAGPPPASVDAAAAAAEARGGGGGDRQGDAGGAAGDTAQAAPAVAGDRLLEYPDELQMLMLAYRLAGTEPPLDQWAAGNVQVRIADEFSRAAVLREERDRLQRIYDGTRGVGRLRINVEGRLSEYDAGRGGYYIDAFLPGSVLQYRAQPGDGADTIVGLRVSAPAGVEFWPLSPAEAKRVLAGVDVLRQVTLDSEVTLTGAGERGEGLEIAARLDGYRIVGSEMRGSTPLGERRFPPG